MYLLALNTTQSLCSVALLHQGALLSKEKSSKTASHSEEIIPLIEAILKKNDLAYKDIHAIAVHRGPGSFIGIRVGLSAAKGLGLVTKIPLWGVDGFLLAAWKHKNTLRPFIIMHALKASSCYMQAFNEKAMPITPPRYMEFCDILPFMSPSTTLLGKDIAFFTNYCKEKDIPYHEAHDLAPDTAEEVAFYAWHHYTQANMENLASLDALYVRPPDAVHPSSLQNK